MVIETESFTIYAQKKYAKMNGLLKQKRRQFMGDGLRFLIAFYIDLKRIIKPTTLDGLLIKDFKAKSKTMSCAPCYI